MTYGLTAFDDLETWLESAPVTHAWISEQLGLSPYGLQTADAWWSGWSNATNPALTPGIVLAGRSPSANALRQLVTGPAQIITLRAGSLDEALSCVAALALEDDAAGSGELLARMAFVDDVGTWRALADRPQPLVLVARTAEVAAEAASSPKHHVIVPLTGEGEAGVELPPIDAGEAAEALKVAGVDDQRADDAGRLARRSLLALRRHLARKPELHTPAWATAPVGRHVRGILLAGAWRDDAPSDQAVLAELTGAAYDDLREELTNLAAYEDPLILRVGQTWTVVSPFDAWRQLRTWLRPDDLSRLRPIVTAVLLEADPAFELAPEERWRASFDRKTRQHSSELRGGISTTLALLGAEGARVDGGQGANGSDVAADLVRVLLIKANEGATGAGWSALSHYLPLLAEAAPDAFLDAARDGTAGDEPVLARLFTDSDDSHPLFSSSSPHAGLLWALELLAWSPDHFGQAVDLLARLSEIDPGGRLLNRPSHSVSEIFCPWHPETTASNARRLEVIDALRERHPDLTWPLMVALLPEHHGVHGATSSPRFRDWKPTTMVVTNLQWFEFIAGLVSRLIEDAQGDPLRWQDLIHKATHATPGDRARIRDELARRVVSGNLESEGRETLWDALRKLIARHREFAHTDWALGADELDALGEIERQLAPGGVVDQLAWLFADHMPRLGDGLKLDDFEALGQRRRAAVAEIAQSEGWQGVLDLAARAVVPGAVGDALAETDGAEHETAALALLELAAGNHLVLGIGYCSRRYFDGGWEWFDQVLADHPTLTSRQIARLLRCRADFPMTWERADELGEEVAAAYWREFSPLGLGADYPHVAVTARRLMAAERPAGALQLLTLYARHEEETDESLAPVVADALEAVAEHQDDPELEQLQHYEFETLFDFLEKHKSALGAERVARLEWAYLPALGYEPRVESLHEALASDPSFFVQVISTIYPRHSEPLRESGTPEEQAIASNAYSLLSSWKRPPGREPDGSLDASALGAWVDAVMPLLDEADRREVGEIQLGHVLASAPADGDGAWPCVEVRDLVERLRSERVEDGLRTQIFNNRGVTSRNREEGGDQERDLAKRYRDGAGRFTDRWPRIASILRSLAEGYERDARREDEEAERRRKGLDP